MVHFDYIWYMMTLKTMQQILPLVGPSHAHALPLNALEPKASLLEVLAKCRKNEIGREEEEGGRREER